MAEGGGFSLAFTAAAKKPVRKIELQESEGSVKKEVITGVDRSGGLTAAEPRQPKAAPKIIPRQDNTYRCVTALTTTALLAYMRAHHIPLFLSESSV